MKQRVRPSWAPRRREQAADAWSRNCGYLQPSDMSALLRLQNFIFLAESIGASATPQLGFSLPLQPAAPEHLKLVYSRSESAPGDGTLAG